MPIKQSASASAAPKSIPAKSAKKSTASQPQKSGKAGVKGHATIAKVPKKVTQAPKLKTIFESAGFRHVPADGLHFTVGGRTGELDHIFVWENVVLLCEETAIKDATKHCTNKIYLHNKISEHWSTSFYGDYTKQNPALLEALGSKYQVQDIEVRHIYYSEEVDVFESIGDPSPMLILSRAQARYFASLVETIARSAKYELLK